MVYLRYYFINLASKLDENRCDNRVFVSSTFKGKALLFSRGRGGKVLYKCLRYEALLKACTTDIQSTWGSL